MEFNVVPQGVQRLPDRLDAPQSASLPFPYQLEAIFSAERCFRLAQFLVEPVETYLDVRVELENCLALLGRGAQDGVGSPTGLFQCFAKIDGKAAIPPLEVASHSL